MVQVSASAKRDGIFIPNHPALLVSLGILVLTVRFALASLRVHYLATDMVDASFLEQKQFVDVILVIVVQVVIFMTFLS
jgi:hypothetical protein